VFHAMAVSIVESKVDDKSFDLSRASCRTERSWETVGKWLRLGELSQWEQSQELVLAQMHRHFKPTEHRSEGRYFSEVESLRVVLKMKHLREMYRFKESQ